MVKRKYTNNDSIEGRRVGKSGDSFIIPIPREWLEQNDLVQGDVVECLVNENRIVITQRRWSNE